MPFVKDEVAIERRGVLQFLQTIQNHSPLVMDAVHLRALEEIADPSGSFDVHVIEVFTKGSVEQAPGSGFYRKTKQKKIDCPDN